MGRTAEGTEIDGISGSFAKLRRLADTFDSVAGGTSLPPRTQKQGVKLARELGATAVPLLSRKLRAEDHREASWAYFLLARVGGDRTIAAVRDVALDGAVTDDKKALALALLTELGAELPDSIHLRDPQALREGSVRELISTLTGPGEVARAADLLIAQVVDGELATLIAEMAEVVGVELAPLVAELLLRDDLPRDAAAPLAALRDRLGTSSPSVGVPEKGATRRVHAGACADGRRAVTAVSPRTGHDGKRRVRALTVIVGADGRLADVTYEDELLAPARRMVDRLARDGFGMQAVSVAIAARVVADAARATAARGRLPREYYLGRDLLGLHDEHLGARPPRAVKSDDAEKLLDEGAALLDGGDPRRAKKALERYVSLWPEDAEGRTCLGSCLLELGEHDEALRHFAVASRLEPDDAIRWWNLAHAAKKGGKLGSCYLALLAYLARRDRDDGAAGRIRSARRYLKLFERYARLEHPEASAERVARGEELFHRAHAHLRAGRHQDAVSGFEAVLKIVPSHYPSWGNLGAAYLALRRREDAERCLKKALEYRPDYDVARKNLAAMSD